VDGEAPVRLGREMPLSELPSAATASAGHIAATKASLCRQGSADSTDPAMSGMVKQSRSRPPPAPARRAA
jgi:hypothetical protein